MRFIFVMVFSMGNEFLGKIFFVKFGICLKVVGFNKMFFKIFV